MLFNQLKSGDEVHILEIMGTFKKSTEYYIGHVSQISQPYDEPLPAGLFAMPNQPRKRVIDITVSCNGESRKFTIADNKSIINDSTVGLTIATDKSEIVTIIRNQYNTYKQRKESIAKCDEEMNKCQQLLNKLEIVELTNDLSTARIAELESEIRNLKDIIKQAGLMVPQPIKQALPLNMQLVLNEAGQ